MKHPKWVVREVDRAIKLSNEELFNESFDCGCQNTSHREDKRQEIIYNELVLRLTKIGFLGNEKRKDSNE